MNWWFILYDIVFFSAFIYKTIQQVCNYNIGNKKLSHSIHQFRVYNYMSCQSKMFVFAFVKYKFKNS